MSKLTINDLKDTEELDKAAMQDLHGGGAQLPAKSLKSRLDRHLAEGDDLSDLSILKSIDLNRSMK